MAGRYLFIVSPTHRQLYEHLARAFADAGDVQAVVDRRHGEQRQTATGPPGQEDRRRRDRRSRPEVDQRLRTVGWALVRLD